MLAHAVTGFVRLVAKAFAQVQRVLVPALELCLQDGPIQLHGRAGCGGRGQQCSHRDLDEIRVGQITIAVGKCEPPFTSAGGHFNPDGKKHGKMADGGAHAGDMNNLEIPASGALTTDVVNDQVTLDKGRPNSVFKDGGTALVIHAKADDYKSDPAGNAGDRIACGVIEEAK